jgi:response regulator of citrate/malate metabolism
MVATFEASGLTQVAFAKKRRISKWTLREWIIRLKEEEGKAAPAPASDPIDRLDHILLDAARRRGGLTTGEVAKALGLTRVKARKYLLWLVDEGRLVRRGETPRTMTYTIPQ